MDISLTFIITIIILALLTFVWEIIINRSIPTNPNGRIIIYGAGKAGQVLAGRIIEKCNYKNWDFSKTEIVGFIDDDPGKEGIVNLNSSINAKLKVFGDYTTLDHIINSEGISAAVVAIGNPDKPKHVKEVVETCRKNRINCFQFDFNITKIS